VRSLAFLSILQISSIAPFVRWPLNFHRGTMVFPQPAGAASKLSAFSYQQALAPRQLLCYFFRLKADH
jgi:hypothetical protein